MNYSQLIITLVITILGFQVNHRIKRLYDIKILINSIFDLFGKVESFSINDPKDINNQLMQEIINLEKMHDNNNIVEKEIRKIRKLRLIWFNHSTNSMEPKQISEGLAEINFNDLGTGFIILAFFNVKK